jgi:mannose-6-phosphate isomerase-like protein (cupin superfamily)
MNLQSVLLAVTCTAVLAQGTVLAQSATPPSEMLDAKSLRITGEELLKQAKVAKDGIGYKVLLTRPDGNEQEAVRVKSGQGEWHHDYVDVLIGIEGEGQVITGGEVVNGKETAPGEIRGDGVKGGKVQPFRPGDVIRIEAQVAHQFLVPPGTTLRYFAVKIKVK